MDQDGDNGDPDKPPTPPPSPPNLQPNRYLWVGYPIQFGTYNPLLRGNINHVLEDNQRELDIEAAEALLQLSQDPRPPSSTAPLPVPPLNSRRRRLLLAAMNEPHWQASHYFIGGEPRGRALPARIPTRPVPSDPNYRALTREQARFVRQFPQPQPNVAMPAQAPAVVDLTTSPTQDRSDEAKRLKRSRAQYESCKDPTALRRSRSPGGSPPPPSDSDTKRMRGGPSQGSSSNITVQSVVIDDEDFGAQDVLQRQRMEQIEAQKKDEHERTFKKNQCSICLDRPTDQTSTPCGHVFCNMCINEALKAGEAQGPKKSRCPVCRQPVKRSSLIVLELKLRTKSQD